MKMTAKRAVRAVVCAAVCSCLCCGCGKGLQIVIQDGYVQTQTAAKEGETVESVLAGAQIAVGERDVVSPATDETLSEDGQQIVISRYAKVSVAYGGVRREVELTGMKVKDAFDALGIRLYPNDYVNHSPEAYLEDGMELFALRRSEVTLAADGAESCCVTTAFNVDDFLAEQGIKLSPRDRVRPAGTTPLCDGIRIEVDRVSVETVTERETIAFETKIEYSDQLCRGETMEKTAGVDGEKEITYEIVNVNGRPGEKTAVGEKTVREPVARVVVYGTKEKETPKTDGGGEQKPEKPSVVSRQKVPDCDGSGHGYYVITWSDGTVEYEDY